MHICYMNYFMLYVVIKYKNINYILDNIICAINQLTILDKSQKFPMERWKLPVFPYVGYALPHNFQGRCK